MELNARLFLSTVARRHLWTEVDAIITEVNTLCDASRAKAEAFQSKKDVFAPQKPRAHARRWKALAKKLLTYKRECESISRELGLPIGIRPANGEFARMKDGAIQQAECRALLVRLAKCCSEAEPARSVRLASITWEVAVYLTRTHEPGSITRKEAS